MDKILSIGILRSSVSQKAARIGPCKVLVKMKKFLQNFQISKIDDFHSKSLTLRRTTGTRFCRTELLRTPFERILSILSSFYTAEHHRSICTHQAHHMCQQKIQYQLFFPYLSI